MSVALGVSSCTASGSNVDALLFMKLMQVSMALEVFRDSNNVLADNWLTTDSFTKT